MAENSILKNVNAAYAEKYGFHDEEKAVFKTPRGLSEKTVRQISACKKEPKWMLDLRLKALRIFKQKTMPAWGGDLSKIDFDSITYYIKPNEKTSHSWDDVPESIRRTFERLGVPEAERKFLGGVGAQYESETVYHNLREDLKKKGVVFLDTDTALKEHPELFKKYFATVVPVGDNKFAALNTAVWSGGSFIYVPPGVHVGIPLQAYFRINAKNVGQFERTLIIVDKNASVHYIEGCLPAGEEVTLGDTQVAIENIKEGQTVINSNGEETTVKKTMIRPYKGDLIEIVPVSVGNKFKLTSEHPVLVIKKSKVWTGNRKNRRLNDVSLDKLKKAKPEFVEAGKLEEGDLLIFPINKVIRKNEKFTDSHLKFLGYYLAEGRACKINNCDAVVLSFNDGGRNIIEDAKQRIFDIIGKLPSEFHDPRKHELRLTVYSKELAAFAEKHCGKCAQHKKLSKTIMELPPERQKILLDAYYDGNGSKHFSRHGNGTVCRTLTTSRVLAFQLQELLSRQGIYAYINIQGPYSETMKDGRTIHHKRKYVVYYQGVKRFATVKKIGNNFIVPIRKINTEKYSGNVYNFHVSSEPNTYLVKGFAVHNCTAPVYTTDSLHTAVVELVALPGSKVRYTTIQNWSNNVYNLVTKRAVAHENAVVEWVDGNLGSKLTMKYPCVVLKGEGARADILSIAYAGKNQHQDAGGKAIHLAKNTQSRIISKSISKDGGRTSYRGLLHVGKGCTGVRSTVQCDALLLDDISRSDTYPTMKIKEKNVSIGHEATVGRIGQEQLFYLMSRGMSESEAMAMIVLGFIAEFTKELPMEYAVELNKLIQLEMEGSVG